MGEIEDILQAVCLCFLQFVETNGAILIKQTGCERGPYDGCLKVQKRPVYQSWFSRAESDSIAVKTGPVSFPGDYPQASLYRMDTEELRGKTGAELRIMRNEIYARYGYIFSQGGEMEAYFIEKEWYDGQHENVDEYLTEIEKENIALIRTIEDAQS